MIIREFEGPIVVGIDGSARAVDAARWASDEAAARGLPLRLIHVMRPLPHAEAVFGAPDMDRDYGEEVMASAVSATGETGSSIVISAELVTGSVREVFVHESHSASMVVLGSISAGGFGSAALAVAELAACPVVLVHRFNPNATGPVVVDLRTGDEAPADDPVVAQAFRTADGRWVGVRSVHTQRIAQRLVHTFATPNVMQESAGELGRLTPWVDRYPSTPIDSINIRIEPSERLAALTEDAQVLVVGHRRGSSFGSGLHAALRFAGCPVLVVPHD